MNHSNLIIDRFFCKAIILTIPLISSLFFLPSENRPLVAIFVLPLSVFFFLKRKIGPKDRLVIALNGGVACLGIYGVLVGLLNQVGTLDIAKQAFIYYIGALSLFGFYNVFLKLSDLEVYRCFKFIAYIMVFLGGVEFLSMIGLLPLEIKKLLNLVIAGNYTSRLQVVVSEASWAAKIILFVLASLVFFKPIDERYPRVLMVSLFFLFWGTLSLYGILILVSSVVLYFMLTAKSVFRFVGLMMLWSIVVMVLCYLLLMLALSYSGDVYYLNRFVKALNVTDVQALLYLDGSVFIRIGNGLIAILMFVDRPFGVGLGGYAKFYSFYIQNYFPYALSFTELYNDVVTGTADPKGLYFKIIAEFGILGVAFLGMIVVPLKKLRRAIMFGENSVQIIRMKKLLFMVLVMLSTAVQTGSFVYFPYWFVIALCFRESNNWNVKGAT